MLLTISTSNVRGLRKMEIDVDYPEGRKTLAETIRSQQRRGVVVTVKTPEGNPRVVSYNQKANEFTVANKRHIEVTNTTTLHMIGQPSGG
jgi:hypothetical protein